VSLPKPVIVVLVIVLVLAVVGCGLSALRSSEQNQSGDQREDELRHSNLTDLFARFAPPSKPVELADISASCGSAASGVLAVSSSCIVSVGPKDDARRRLLLRPETNPMTITVSSHASGRDSVSQSESIPVGSDKASIVLGSGDSASVAIVCFSGCSVAINPTPAP